MNKEYIFYYDESGHNRKLTEKSIMADNFDDFFVSVTVGINNNQLECLTKKYLLFEEQYKNYYKVSELKSTIFSDKNTNLVSKVLKKLT